MEPISEVPRIVNKDTVSWISHPRFAGILMKPLLTDADNALANVSLVRVPPGHQVDRHIHSTQVETVYFLTGQAMLTVGIIEKSFTAGEIVAIPIGMEHALRNVGTQDIEVLAFFTPPII